jgi:hypothetical protein
MSPLSGSPLTAECIEINVPGRLDGLPWSRWHLLVVTALGITWLLDGLDSETQRHTGIQRRSTWTKRDLLPGRICRRRAPFGYLTDRLGRKKLLSLTLLLYLSATVATAFSWNFGSFAFFRALTGAGIGGEYAAADELSMWFYRESVIKQESLD